MHIFVTALVFGFNTGPDPEYWTCVVFRADCVEASFKNMAEDFSDYNQQEIFNAQKGFISEADSVSILSAFPLFLFDYFPKERLLSLDK